MRNQRSDSVTAQVSAMQEATLGPIQPPGHVKLRAGDLPFWNAIVCARARITWTDVDLAHAANLSRCQADIERLQTVIDSEGDTVVNQRGTQIVNPLHTLLETLSRRAVALSRMLHVHAEATVGESGKSNPIGPKNEAKKASEGADDALIPKLRAV